MANKQLKRAFSSEMWNEYIERNQIVSSDFTCALGEALDKGGIDGWVLINDRYGRLTAVEIAADENEIVKGLIYSSDGSGIIGFENAYPGEPLAGAVIVGKDVLNFCKDALGDVYKEIAEKYGESTVVAQKKGKNEYIQDSFNYMSEDFAKLDTEKSMFRVYIDESGEKRIHYLGYFYENDEGLKLIEYTGFDVPFYDAYKVGLLEYETDNGDVLGGQQYITDYTEDETADSFDVMKNYFKDETVVFLHKDHQFEDLPCGCYAASIFTFKELQNLYEEQLEAQLTEPVPEKVREAANHYGFYAAEPYVLKHQDALLYCYENRIGEIDYDSWVHYEELLGEKISWDEYVEIDSHFEDDVLEVGPGSKEVKRFKNDLAKLRASKSVDEKIAAAKDTAAEHNGNVKDNKEKSVDFDK